jgi:hypothetical protein
LGFKLRVPESEYPLLCEAVRRQRGELALKLLVKFKDEKSALGTILDKLLDKSILSGVKSTSIFSERRNISPIPPVQEFSNITIRQIRSQSSADESSVYLNTGRRKSRTSSMGCNRIQRKRNAACSYNINSSASEEAMLSDDNHDVRNFNLNRPNSPLSSEELRDDSSDSTDSQERLQAQVLQPPPGILANNQAAQANVSGNQQVSNTGNNRRRRTGKGNTVIPDVPNAPSDSLAHFYSGLAKKISEHAGTRDGVTRNEAGYFQHDGNPNAPPYSRNLHLASFEVNLYALAIHNSITPTWLSRNYSRHGKSVTSQATEIGPTAIDVLVTSWEGHLTCSETIKLAHMVSKQSDLHNEMQKSAAELALSCLDHCSLLNPNDIRNALVQCREYSLSEFKQALITVETNAIDRDGLIPEALFEVSKQWEWLHEYQTNSTMHRKGNRKTFERLADPPLPPLPNNQYQYPLPVNQFPNINLPVERPPYFDYTVDPYMNQQRPLPVAPVQNNPVPGLRFQDLIRDPVTKELESAARVGLLGVEQTIKRNHDERSNLNNLFRHDTISTFRKPNPHENDIIRIMDICIFIGQTKFDQFSQIFLKTTNSLKDCCLLVRIVREAAYKFSIRNDFAQIYNYRIPVYFRLFIN